MNMNKTLPSLSPICEALSYTHHLTSLCSTQEPRYSIYHIIKKQAPLRWDWKGFANACLFVTVNEEKCACVHHLSFIAASLQKKPRLRLVSPLEVWDLLLKGCTAGAQLRHLNTTGSQAQWGRDKVHNAYVSGSLRSVTIMQTDLWKDSIKVELK